VAAPRRLLRKRLSYRDQTGKPVAAHAAHWADFVWTAGPVIVASVGPWGTVQCWAASEAEGKRVIRHAAAIAGFDPDANPEAEWIVSQAPAGRLGRVAQMRVLPTLEGIGVSKRQGPSGPPELVEPT
jgi:hypothetical protein